MLSMQSSNPALANQEAFNPYAYYEKGAAPAVRADTATLQGVVNKTGMLVLIAVAAGALGYWALGHYGPNVLMLSCVVGLIGTLAVYFTIARKPLIAHLLGPVYAVIEGLFLGALTAGLEAILEAQQIAVPGGLALQAFVITGAVMSSMLLLYKARILKPTARFTAVISTVTLGIFLTYLLSFILSLFGVQLPFVSLASAFEGGTPALIGLGINALFLVVAALALIIDFGTVEETLASGAPKRMEWYCGFALLVGLAWVYFEALKIVFRLAMLFGNRD
jgi:uncharacterized YccA/Bax inhibitor family protein